MNQRKKTMRYRRSALGAVMAETVLVLPFIMLSIMLIVYLGWNFRRLAQVTNMDRYAVWEAATPGAPGPDAQGLPQDMRNPQLNAAFFGYNRDLANDLDELRATQGVRYLPEGHRQLRDSQSDETYSYFDQFLDRNPTGLRQRFSATHPQSMNTDLLGLSDLIRNGDGHSRLNGDWRFADGIRYNSESEAWEPASRHVVPGEAMREVFFVDLDDGLEPYDNNGNNLAGAIRDFYLAYPGYVGPDIGSRDSEFQRRWFR
ncbi:MAG: TadE/TadG family type IV pilus assembly protein [Phycisphaeraceae bacterium]